MMIPSTKSDEDGLSFQPKLLTQSNGLGGGEKLIAEVIIGWIKARDTGGIKGIEERLEVLLKIKAGLRKLGKRLLHQVTIMQLDEAMMSGIFDLHRIRRAAIPRRAECECSGLRNHELLSVVPNLEKVVSAKGNVHGGLPGIGRAVHHIRHAASPSAELGHALRHRGLPLINLVTMREQCTGQRHALREILRLVGWLDERADVRYDGSATLRGIATQSVEKLLKSCTTRMDAIELSIAAGILIQGPQRGLIQREIATRGRVDRVSRIVTGNEHVERVHASIEEDADERLAVCGRTISCGLVRHFEVEQHVHYRD